MCDQFRPDHVFQRFEVFEFPTSFVGLSTTMNLDLGADLTTSAYLKTMHDGKLLVFFLFILRIVNELTRCHKK